MNFSFKSLYFWSAEFHFVLFYSLFFLSLSLYCIIINTVYFMNIFIISALKSLFAKSNSWNVSWSVSFDSFVSKYYSFLCLCMSSNLCWKLNILDNILSKSGFLKIFFLKVALFFFLSNLPVLKLQNLSLALCLGTNLTT